MSDDYLTPIQWELQQMRAAQGSADPPAGPAPHQPATKTQAAELIELAEERFRLVHGNDGVPYAIDTRGDLCQLLPLKGRGSVRHHLGEAFLHRNGKPASTQAISDAINVMEGRALNDGERVEPNVRVAMYDGQTVVIDTANPSLPADQRYLLVNPDEARGTWFASSSPPVRFKRSELTGPLPQPGDEPIDGLRKLVNVSDADWHVLVCWMIATLIPNRPVPILWLTGEQGTGKSTAARLVVGLLDPGPAPLQAAPRDPGEWALLLQARRVVGLDNVSRIPEWFSDALCRAVTGDAYTKRRLYTDAELMVVDVQRPIIVTTIDAGALRGDLVERLLPLELEPIGQGRRRTEAQIREWLAGHGSGVYGGLLQLTAEVLDAMPAVYLVDKPRMADFAELLAAYDHVIEQRTGQNPRALERYLTAQTQVFADAVADDPVGSAVVEFVAEVGQWEGSASALLEKLEERFGDGRKPKDWPGGAPRLAAALKRLAPSLRAVGVQWEYDRTKSRRVHRLSGDGRVTVGDGGDRHPKTRVITGDSDPGDGGDGGLPQPSTSPPSSPLPPTEEEGGFTVTTVTPTENPLGHMAKTGDGGTVIAPSPTVTDEDWDLAAWMEVYGEEFDD